MKPFNNILKQLRTENNLSKQEPGRAIKVSANTIAHWEDGTRKPLIRHVIALSRFFSVKTDYLLGLSKSR